MLGFMWDVGGFCGEWYRGDFYFFRIYIFNYNCGGVGEKSRMLWIYVVGNLVLFGVGRG